jgi:hypothetical protein
MCAWMIVTDAGAAADELVSEEALALARAEVVVLGGVKGSTLGIGGPMAEMANGAPLSCVAVRPD